MFSGGSCFEMIEMHWCVGVLLIKFGFFFNASHILEEGTQSLDMS